MFLCYHFFLVFLFVPVHSLTLYFLKPGHATAEDLVKAIKNEMTDLNARDLLQISMDGPAVNLKVFNIFKGELERDFGHLLIDIGSCGLHTLHNAFQSGESKSGWDLANILKSLYYLFKDAPARKEDYLSCAGAGQLMPQKFVSHRWLENVPVCKRAILIWSCIEKYVEKVNQKEFMKPTSRSYESVSNAVRDKLVCVKLEFFCLVASILLPFLTNYQSDKPLVPFLAADLAEIIRCLMKRFIESEIIDTANTCEKLCGIDILNKENHTIYSKIDIGLAAEEKLKGVGCSDKQIMEFKMQCKEFLIGVLKKCWRNHQ